MGPSGPSNPKWPKRFKITWMAQSGSKNLVSLKILLINSFGTPCVLKYLEMKTCEDIAISEIITALALPAANYIENKRNPFLPVFKQNNNLFTCFQTKAAPFLPFLSDKLADKLLPCVYPSRPPKLTKTLLNMVCIRILKTILGAAKRIPKQL